MPIAYLCLGSNIGDKVGYIQQAINLLVSSGNVSIVRSSAFYETEPWGNKSQDWFVNAAVEIKTKLSPQELLALCLDTEKQLGRVREPNKKWSSRCIDIDILLYGDEIVNDENLKIPHRHMHERAFVLVPMLELVPDYIHPVFDKTLMDLYDEIEEPEDIFLYGARFDLND